MASSRREQTVEADLLTPVRDRLAELARLAEDWDSYGARPPAPKVLDEALRFAAQVVDSYWFTVKERALPTSISPLPSGGIELEWRQPEDLIAIDIGPGGDWGYLRKHGTGHQARYNEGIDISRDALIPLLSEVLLSQRPG